MQGFQTNRTNRPSMGGAYLCFDFAGSFVADKKQTSSGSRIADKFSKMQSEIAIGIALILAAGGFTLAQLDVDLPFQWCPTGTVDRVECFRGWLLPLAGWIAAIFAYLTIRQVRKQVDNLEEEIEKNSAAERKSSFRSFKNEMLNFHDLELQLFQDLDFAIKYYSEHKQIEPELYTKITSMLSQLNGYDWSRLRYMDPATETGTQIELLRSTLAKIEKSAGNEKTFIDNAKHYVFVREIFYETIEDQTGIDFADS